METSAAKLISTTQTPWKMQRTPSKINAKKTILRDVIFILRKISFKNLERSQRGEKYTLPVQMQVRIFDFKEVVYLLLLYKYSTLYFS